MREWALCSFLDQKNKGERIILLSYIKQLDQLKIALKNWAACSPLDLLTQHRVNRLIHTIY